MTTWWLVTVEIANRSGAEVDEEAPPTSPGACLAAEGIEDGDLGLVVRRPGGDAGAEARAPRQSTRRPTSSRSRSTDARSLPPGVPRQLGDAVHLPAGRRRRMARAARPRPAAPPRLRPRRSDGGPGGGARVVSASPRRAPSLLESFNFAFEGVIHVLRTQRNMRIHFGIAAAVLIAAVALGVGRIELIALMIAISFVLIAEMINSALEAGIDVATTSFDPLAKLAKDIAAGRRSDRDRERGRRRLPRLLGSGLQSQLACHRAAARRAVRADADRARADDHPRARDEGLYGPWHAACAVACRPVTRRSHSAAGWR